MVTYKSEELLKKKKLDLTTYNMQSFEKGALL